MHPLIHCGREGKGKAKLVIELPFHLPPGSSIFGTWLDYFSQDFCEPPHFPCLKLLLNYLVIYMPGSEVEVRTFLLLDHWEMEAKSEEPGDRGQRAHEEGCVHTAPPCVYS
jgi:hypothetical protein